MPEVLIAALSPNGHIGPLLSVAQGLVDRGDQVTVLTSAIHAERIRAVGAVPLPVPAEAYVDHTRLGTDLLERAGTSGVKRLNFDIVEFFLRPMPYQTRALSEVLARTAFDALIVDAGFFGILPFLLGSDRPPVLVYTTTPLPISSRDTAPFGMSLPPSATPLGRLHNRALNIVAQRVLLRRSQRAANNLLDRMNTPRLPVFVLDSGVLADRYVAPTVPEFDYPRSDLPGNVHYVGAVHPTRSRSFALPPWWSELDDERPVVYVTQGTVDTVDLNVDLSRLLAPTIRALAEQDVTVVATTGGHPLQMPIPANTLVAGYIPHDLLLPKVDVMVTNGGYGAVQRALTAGVPLVVAGDTGDKPEVAARVAWSGAGINLRTGCPTPGAIRTAVHEVLTDHRYLLRARDLEAAFARRDGVAEIAALLDEVIAERARAAQHKSRSRLLVPSHPLSEKS